MLKTACGNSEWFDFYDLSKLVILSYRTGFSFSLLLRKFFAPLTIWTIDRIWMKFGMQLHYGKTSGCFRGFFEIFNLFLILLFFHKHVEKQQICRSFMTLGMLLYYRNTSGCFQGFMEFWIFFCFLLFSQKTDRNFCPHVPRTT